MLGWVALLLHLALTEVTWCSSVGGWFGLRVQDDFTHMLDVLIGMALALFPSPCSFRASPHAVRRRAVKFLHSALLRTLEEQGESHQFS